ncbi:MAG: nitroreductase [Chloroflexi bacterium]|nr:nitroreductase [Chloroflexota bacterium]MYF21380.1 nitroreductase [Chloroflexota bacterium]
MPRYGRLGLPLYEAIYSMRAIRRMRPDPVSDEDLEIILDAARQAPNGGNAQPWHFVVVRDPQLKRELGALYHEAWWAKRADEGIEGPDHPAFENPVRRSAMRLADEIGEAPVMILLCASAQGPGAANSVIPSVQNLLLAARGLGIGGTITTLHPVVDDRVKALLEIPDEAQIVYCVPLGYPRGRFGPLNRKPLREIVSEDKWGSTPDWIE